MVSHQQNETVKLKYWKPYFLNKFSAKKLLLVLTTHQTSSKNEYPSVFPERASPGPSGFKGNNSNSELFPESLLDT